MRQKQLFLCALLGCSAPDVQPVSPSPSPVEKQSKRKPNQLRLIPHKKPPATQPAAKEITPEDQPEEYKAPYTAWTNQKHLSLKGPNGGTIMHINRQGTRVDILQFSGNYARIICSGCAPPKQNQAGWVTKDSIQNEWQLNPESALYHALQLRKKWSKGKDLPETTNQKSDLCMLIDNGFLEKEESVEWSIQGGILRLITTKGDEKKWQTDTLTTPSKPAAAGWRCDIQYPKKDG